MLKFWHKKRPIMVFQRVSLNIYSDKYLRSYREIIHPFAFETPYNMIQFKKILCREFMFDQKYYWCPNCSQDNYGPKTLRFSFAHSHYWTTKSLLFQPIRWLSLANLHIMLIKRNQLIIVTVIKRFLLEIT